MRNEEVAASTRGSQAFFIDFQCLSRSSAAAELLNTGQCYCALEPFLYAVCIEKWGRCADNLAGVHGRPRRAQRCTGRLTGRVVKVSDGDTLTVLRVSSIDLGSTPFAGVAGLSVRKPCACP